jgi:hypothetical protein
VSAQLITHFGDKVFRTIIPRNIRLAEAPSFGKPVLFHDKESRGALSYLALAGEMIRREEQGAAPAAPPPVSTGGEQLGDEAGSAASSAATSSRDVLNEASSEHATEHAASTGRLAAGSEATEKGVSIH